LSNTSPKNRTRFADFAYLAHKWSVNQSIDIRLLRLDKTQANDSPNHQRKLRN